MSSSSAFPTSFLALIWFCAAEPVLPLATVVVVVIAVCVAATSTIIIATARRLTTAPVAAVAKRVAVVEFVVALDRLVWRHTFT